MVKGIIHIALLKMTEKTVAAEATNTRSKREIIMVKIRNQELMYTIINHVKKTFSQKKTNQKVR